MPRTTTRSARRDDDDFEDLARRGPRDGDDPSHDEDDRPRRTVSRRRSRDDEEEERPRRPARRSRDEDEEDERPRRSRRSGEEYDDGPSEVSTSMGRGREGLRQHRERAGSKSGFPERFKFENGERVLIKFLDDDFFITYYEHFIREFLGEGRQCSFICLGDDCPLCEIGDEPRFYALINVLDLRNPRKPQVKVWYTTKQPGELIEEAMDDAGSKPINRPDVYFVTSKKKVRGGKFTEYTLKAVKARDLEDDYDVEPLDDEELEAYDEKVWGDDIVRVTPRKELREIADELSGD